MTRLAPILDLRHKQSAKILFLTDLHYPDNDRAFIRRTLKNEYDAIIFGGDITESHTIKSPGASVTGCSEREAYEQFKEDLTLIRPDMPMECVLGNHDNRANKLTGQNLSILEEVCNNHRIGFSPNHTIWPIRVGDSSFKICITHGSGGGATENAILTLLKRVRDAIDATCDLYLCGHFHKYVWVTDDFKATRWTRNNLQFYGFPQYLGACGSPATWEGGYAEGGPHNRPFKSVTAKGLEIELVARGKNHRDIKQIQHRILY